MSIQKVRNIIFLRDVSILSFTAFGGPQGHFGLFLNLLVTKRAYLTEDDLIELYALCQVLPGPTSTQTITSLGYKIGGPNLAYLTLLVWMLPAVGIMTSLAILVGTAQDLNISLDFLRFIEPIAVGIVAYSSYQICTKVINSKMSFILMLISALASYVLKTPWAFPSLIILGGLVTSWKYKNLPLEEKERIKINWSNFILWGVVFVAIAILGAITRFQPILILENFYRNGSLIFGGGQVLVPLLFTEFVEFKQLLSKEQFINGYGMAQAIPGPTFSFSAYVGALSVEETGIGIRIFGAIMAVVGIFLPGTFLIFFIIRFWEQLKKYRFVRASLEGITAVSAGMVIAATILLIVPMKPSIVNYTLMLGTATTLLFTKFPAPIIVLVGLLLGLLIP